MASEVEELIKEIAVKHGIAVSRDDPIFVLQTVNHHLMRDSARAQQAILDRYKEELQVIVQTWSADAKGIAERVLNVAMTAAKEAMAKVMEQGATTAAESMRAEINQALDRVAENLRHSRRIVVLNLAASVLTLIAAGLSLWTMLPA